jgi:hypothetical protein
MPAEKKPYRGRTLPDFIRPDKEKQSSRRFLGGNETTTIVVQLKTVTPILGGGYRTRKLDDMDVIRVPTIRGHLRFWWRALYAQGFIDKDNGNKIDSKKLRNYPLNKPSDYSPSTFIKAANTSSGLRGCMESGLSRSFSSGLSLGLGVIFPRISPLRLLQELKT